LQIGLSGFSSQNGFDSGFSSPASGSAPLGFVVVSLDVPEPPGPLVVEVVVVEHDPASTQVVVVVVVVVVGPAAPGGVSVFVVFVSLDVESHVTQMVAPLTVPEHIPRSWQADSAGEASPAGVGLASVPPVQDTP